VIATDEKTLWTRWKDSADSEAREELIVRYMRVVKYVAGRIAIHVPSSVEMDDLIGWGVLGLIDAVEKYDPFQDIKFSTYASIRVRGAIIDQIRSLDWAPRSLRAMARRINEARDTLRQREGRDPTIDEIAAELDTTPEHVDETMAQLQTAHILSLDDYLPSDESEDGRKIDLTSDARAANPEKMALEGERQERLVEAILKLPDQQQKVLNLYYYEELTLKEIGMVLDVTESRVCQIHKAAMQKLRKVVRGGA